MKVKICPLCDSEMKKAHYCDTCKSFVWRPEILDVHYNAQQRGLGEEDCAYGETHDTKDHGGDIYGRFSDAMKKTDKTRKTDKKARNQSKSSSHEEVYGKSEQKPARSSYRTGTSGRNPERSKRKAGGCLGKIILAIIILNAAAGSIGSNLWHYFTGGHFQYMIQDVIDNLGFGDDISIVPDTSEDDDYGYRELSDEELAEYPDGCNGYAHFEMADEEMGALIEAWTRTEYGRDISGEDSPTEDNYIYIYDGEITSYLQKTTYYNVDGEYNDYVIVYSDSVTGRIHSVTASMDDEERIQSFFNMAVQALDPKADWSEKELKQQWENFIEQIDNGNGGVDIDNMIINGSKYSGGELWLTIDSRDY